MIRKLLSHSKYRLVSINKMSASGSSSNIHNKSVGITTDSQENAAARRAAGEFVRGVSSARYWIGEDADASKSEYSYPVQAGRYHIYAAQNCPWCHRVLLGRALMGLEDVITLDILFPSRSTDDEPLGPNLWKFAPQGAKGINGKHVSFPDCTADTVNGKNYIKEVYELGGVQDQKSVPLLWDKKTATCVNNESAEILRMMGTVLRPLAKRSEIDLYPEALRKEIDEWNDWVYVNIANGSYKAGFSSNQDVHEKAYQNYFDALDKLNERLADRTFLVGNVLTEADVRLFPPLFRHDAVYHNRFKLNKAYLWEYPHIWQWMGVMMEQPGMQPVSDANYLQHCKQGYFGRTGNGTVPLGPPGYPECYKKQHWSHGTLAK